MVTREREIEVEVVIRDQEDVDVDGAGEVPRGQLLVGVPLEVQEAWVCEDLMFVLQVSLHVIGGENEAEL